MFRINAKRLRFLVALLLAASLFIIPVSAKFTTISVYIRGQELICDPMVRRIDDLTYVPLRAFVQALDEEAQFSWSDETQCAVVNASGVEIKIRQDGSYIVANGRYLYLDGGTVRNEEASRSMRSSSRSSRSAPSSASPRRISRSVRSFPR